MNLLGSTQLVTINDYCTDDTGVNLTCGNIQQFAAPKLNFDLQQATPGRPTHLLQKRALAVYVLAIFDRINLVELTRSV